MVLVVSVVVVVVDDNDDNDDDDDNDYGDSEINLLQLRGAVAGPIVTFELVFDTPLPDAAQQHFGWFHPPTSPNF